MATRSRRPSTSIKQILVRNYNWANGNLRRLYCNAHALDPDLAHQVMEAIQEQINRNKSAHERRLAFLEHGNFDRGGYDDVFISAKFEAERNKRGL